MAALAPEDPFDPEALGLRVDLGVEALDHLVRGEQAEVPPLGGVGAQGVVEADLVEEHQVAHAGIGPGIGEVVAGGRDEQDLRALLVDGSFTCTPVRSSMSSTMNSSMSLTPRGLDAQVVSRPEAVRHRLRDPVDVAADEVEELPAHHGDLRLVDAVGAEDRTAAALRALVEVVEPLLEHVDRQVPGAGQPAEAAFPTAVK